MGGSELLTGVDRMKVGGALVAVPIGVPVVAASPAGRGQIVKILDWSCINEQGGQDVQISPELLTVSIQGLFNAPTAVVNPPGAGPLVGIVQWASGGGFQQSIEFDIPCNSDINVGSGGQGDVNSGVMLTILGHSVQVYARSDAAVRPRIGDATLGEAGISASSGRVTASIAIGNRANREPVTRTLYGAYDPAGGLAAAASVTIPVPDFARRFAIQRDASQPITYQVNNSQGARIDGPFALAANVAPPTLDLGGNAGSITITNTGAAPITSVAVIYELGV
jgi:hypothetical protein